ncbi:triacylglycerol lipase 1 isoform X1 [Arachis hypogaea]|uniref:triacylglycerol lipase 1 isoform X1 n=1 Tax=Arachis hypogaea TaxID=3818 RepID=UPI003B21163E
MEFDPIPIGSCSKENQSIYQQLFKLRRFRHALPFYHLLPIFSHQLAGDAWFLNTPEKSLSFILADQGFDVWVGNVCGTRWSHGHRSYSVKNKKFWDWSWQELALYDMVEMINYIYSVTNSKLFIVGHSQMTTGFIQMVFTMGIHQLNFKRKVSG